MGSDQNVVLFREFVCHQIVKVLVVHFIVVGQFELLTPGNGGFGVSNSI